ncbi:MAG: peptidylprolyl isomerase [Prochlorococcaceae cyanobacterium]
MTPSLSGVTDPAVIAIFPRRPLLSVAETNRLLRQQGVSFALAQGLVLDQVAASVEIEADQASGLMEAYLAQEGITDEEQLRVWLTRKGWEAEDLRYFATKTERVRRFALKRYGAEAEIRFLDRKLDLDQVTYSLLRVSDADLAEELYLQLREGEADFGGLVAAYSEGEEKATRGLIGPIAVTAGHPSLVERLRVGRPGQLWPPFAIGEVWVVVRLEERFPAQLDDTTRMAMVEELFQIWFKEQVMLLMAGEELMPLPRDTSDDTP